MLCLKLEHSPYKLGGGHCRFEKLWGKNSLNATVNGRSHYNKSPEPLIWGLFDHSPSESYLSLSLSPFFFFSVDICASPTPSHSGSKPHTARAVLYNLWCCYACFASARCSVQTCCMIPLSGLFQNISDLRQACHWQWTKKRTQKKWWRAKPLSKLAGLIYSKHYSTVSQSIQHSRLRWKEKFETWQD